MFLLDAVFYNRVQHDRLNEAASEKLVLDEVQPQKEAPEGQLKSLVLFIVAGRIEYLSPSFVTSSLTPKEQVFCFHFLILVLPSKKKISDELWRQIVGVTFATMEE